MRVKIKISKKHIQAGKRGSRKFCPIALAIGEALLTEDVYVGVHNLTVNGRLYDLSAKETRFITNFDKGGSVAPFTLVLA